LREAFGQRQLAVKDQAMGVAYVDPDRRARLVAEYEAFDTTMGMQRAEIVGVAEQLRQRRAVQQQDAIRPVQYGKIVALERYLVKGRHSFFSGAVDNALRRARMK
jgi:hypothetical protein